MQQIVKVKRVANPRRKRKSNPVRVVTLGRSNPRRKSTMATRRRRRKAAPRRKANPTRRRRTTAAAPRRRRRSTTRRSNPRVSVRRRRTARRRNPSLFGKSMNSSQIGQAILGGLIGVTATKIIPANLPPSLIGSPIMRIVSSGVVAVLSGWLAGRVSQPFGDAVTFGGLMQTGSMALNAFIPSIGSQIGLRGGLGDLVAGGYPVPQNPIRGYSNPVMVAAGAGDGAYGSSAPVTMSGLARSFGRAF